MTRSSFQNGWIDKRKQKSGTVWLLRYRVRDASRKSGWRTKTETLKHCRSKQAAERVLQKRMPEINDLNNNHNDGPQYTPGISFSEFVSTLWSDYRKNKGIKPSTEYSYESMLNQHLLPAFGLRSLDQIRPVDLTRFFRKLRQKGLSSHYQLNIYALLRSLFELALEYDVILSNPVRKKLHRPRHQSKKKPSLSSDQLRRVLEEIPRLWHPLFVTLALTGLRIGEVLALKWGNIDWEHQQLEILHNLWRGQLTTPKTSASERLLHLPNDAIQELRSHRGRSRFVQEDDLVFCRADGAPLDPGYLRTEILYPALDRAGIKRQPRTHGFHLIRHSVASIVHAETGSLKLAQSQLGHARVSTTGDIYVHTNLEQQKQAAEALAAAIDLNCSLIAHQTTEATETIQ